MEVSPEPAFVGVYPLTLTPKHKAAHTVRQLSGLVGLLFSTANPAEATETTQRNRQTSIQRPCASGLVERTRSPVATNRLSLKIAPKQLTWGGGTITEWT